MGAGIQGPEGSESGALRSAGGAPGGEPFDEAELRRRIALFFTVPELRGLADALGVAGLVRWDRGAQEAARELVRHAAQYCGLELLLARLREARPLVEWPDAPPRAPDAEPPPAPASGPLAGEVTPQDAGAALAPPAEPAPPDAVAVAGYPAPPAKEEAPGPPFAPIPAPAAAPASIRAVPAPWPGTVVPEAAAPRGMDPRILIAVAMLMVFAAVVAFAAGHSAGVRRGSPELASPAEPEGDATARRPDGPATRVADAFSKGLTAVARLCDIPFNGPPSSGLLDVASRRCGASLPPQRPYGPAPGGASDATATPRGDRTARPPVDATRPPPKTGSPCVGACEATHRGCTGRCGPEPLQSSDFGGYQQCLSRCLIDASHCRLACP